MPSKTSKHFLEIMQRGHLNQTMIFINVVTLILIKIIAKETMLSLSIPGLKPWALEVDGLNKRRESRMNAKTMDMIQEAIGKINEIAQLHEHRSGIRYRMDLITRDERNKLHEAMATLETVLQGHEQ